MFNLKFRKPSTKFFLSLSILIIAGFSILLFLGAILMPSFPVGESDDYMLSTISLENRFSLFIFPSDIEQAKSDFPEHMWSWQNYVLMKTDYPGILHPHYFGTYSLSCIPMKILLKHLGSRILPKTLTLNRKQGFTLPLASWFKGEWGTYAEEILMEADPAIFKIKEIENLFIWQRHGYANADRLFALMMFELWRREYKVKI